MNRYRGKLYSYIISLVRDAQIADDAFQDTFIKIIKYLKAGKYSNQNKFLSFAMCIARNLIGDQWRKDAKYLIVNLTQEDYLSLQVNASSTAEDNLIKDQTIFQLNKMIKQIASSSTRSSQA